VECAKCYFYIVVTPVIEAQPMPILQNARHEIFAQSRAKGARLEDAYEDAGFIPGNGHAGKLAQRPEVSERDRRAARRADRAGTTPVPER